MVSPTGGKAGKPASTNSFGESVVDYSDVKAPPAPPAFPLWLKKEWKSIWEIGFWLHRKQHAQLVKTYCEILLQIAEAKDSLLEYEYIEGETTSRSYKALNGSWANYPEIRLIKELLAQKTVVLRELRMTPETSPADVSAIKEIVERMTSQNRGK